VPLSISLIAAAAPISASIGFHRAIRLGNRHRGALDPHDCAA
jgi:hypothetical protein